MEGTWEWQSPELHILIQLAPFVISRGYATLCCSPGAAGPVAICLI
jgi:hypothetical protein